MAARDKNEPGRFLGEGVSFRAKLIGVLEVPEARGDRMCQDALADLKMAIRAAGEHKQRIQVHVAIDGLRLRDDKTGDSLYHHPVHKISFIAQDMTDSRAFGYIFGSPDTGHRFFGIKTDKAASQVVIAMRDLFQVVFELKKKEVELAKQQLEGRSSTVKHGILDPPKPKSTATPAESSTSTSKQPEPPEGGVAELVDLEQELSSLRRGLTQVEGLTPSTDPFGDSFIAPSQNQKGLLPPPPSGTAGRGRPSSSSTKVFSPGKATSLPFDPLASIAADFETPPPFSSLTDNFASTSDASVPYDVFTDLDPLGTGRSRPYVDKKLFFQELKNPPKKVLKDLVPTQSLLTDILPVEKDFGHTTMTSLTRHSGGTVTVAKNKTQSQPQPYSSGTFFSSDPFVETDPFDNTDPFDSFKEDPFTSMQEFPKSILRTDELNAKKAKSKEVKELRYDKVKKQNALSSDGGKNVFNGPLQVTLPPEPTPKSPRLQRQTTDTSSIRQRPQPSSKHPSDSASPPPPLPPKKVLENSKPPPRPPHDPGPGPGDMATNDGPPLPRPARKKEPFADRSMKPQKQLSAQTTSSEEEYLTPAPPPLPSARRFDITLSQLLVCNMSELANRLRVPEATLSSMTLPQLTEYLRSYLAADNERAHIHVELSMKQEKEIEKQPSLAVAPPVPSEKKPVPVPIIPPTNDFTPQFEDNFTPPDSNETFVANFDDFDVKANPTYDRYAAFREIQEQELKSKSILDPDSPKDEDKNDSDDKEELTAINDISTHKIKEDQRHENTRSPLKSLDELTIDSFNMFRNSVSPKTTQIETKIEDIKSVLRNLQVDAVRRSVSPRENNTESKIEDSNDRYAALREITIVEPQEEYESLPPEIQVPKERKRSDERSDGFDNSDFFDCIDNSSLSFSHVDDAFRKSPRIEEDAFRNSPRMEDESFRISPRSEDDACRNSPHLEERAFGNSPRLEDDEFRNSPPLVDEAFKNRPRIEDDMFKNKPRLEEELYKKIRIEEKAFKKSPRLEEKRSPRFSEESFRKSPRVEEDVFKNTSRIEDDIFRKSPRIEEDLFKNSKRIEEDVFDKTPGIDESVFKKGPRIEEDLFKKSPRIEEDLFKKSPRIEEDAFKKSPRIEDVFKKSPRLETKAFGKSPRLEDDTFNNRSANYAFKKSPSIKEREVKLREEYKVEDKKVVTELTPVRDLRPPQRLSTGSISDVASASSPDTKADKQAARAVVGVRSGRWAVLGAGASAGSSDSEPRTRRQRHDRRPMVSSSSSRDASPSPPPPLPRGQRATHHRDRDRNSRHGSSGSRECLDSGSGREKDKRDPRDSRTVSIDSRDSRERDSGRDRRDSGSPRDRRDIKDRDYRDHRRDRRSRERDRENDTWDRDRDRAYSREKEYRDTRDRSKGYRDKDRHRKTRHSYDEDEEEYSDGGSGRSSPRDRWSERWRRDDRSYGSLSWRESRRRNESRQEDPADRRYGSTLGWPSRRSSSRRDGDRERDTRDSRDIRDSRDGRDSRDSRRRSRKEEQRSKSRDYRFSNDFSPRERDPASPFDNEFQDTPTAPVHGKAAKRTPAPYASLEGTRFSFEPEEVTPSPLSASSARRDDVSSASARFRFDSDSLSPRSMFEDDFAAITPAPRGRTASIAEEEDGDLPPLRVKQSQQHRDIKKSESINIFTREADPFEGDAFFACTGSDKAARRENWPGDFVGKP